MFLKINDDTLLIIKVLSVNKFSLFFLNKTDRKKRNHKLCMSTTSILVCRNSSVS